MSIEKACQQLVDEFRSRPRLRAGSLITTVFGDSIAPRGGSVWLGCLIDVMAPFGINERLVRTSVFRLVRDGWLQSSKIGRRSYYSLTEEGRARFEHATGKIYGAPDAAWNGEWCLLLMSGLDAASRDAVRKECRWLGFGVLSTDVLAHPAPDFEGLDKAIQGLGAADELIVMTGETLRGEEPLRRLAHAGWNLDELDARYAHFVQTFRPLMAELRKNPEISPHTAFLVRTLLIQEYRKALLRDPLLPAELLPGNWHGRAAYHLCRNLYRAVFRQADVFVEAAMENADGPLPPPSREFLRRFGGLDRGNSHTGGHHA